MSLNVNLDFLLQIIPYLLSENTPLDDEAAVLSWYNNHKTSEFRTTYEYVARFLFQKLLNSFLVRYQCEEPGMVMEDNNGNELEKFEITCQWNKTYTTSDNFDIDSASCKGVTLSTSQM